MHKCDYVTTNSGVRVCVDTTDIYDLKNDSYTYETMIVETDEFGFADFNMYELYVRTYTTETDALIGHTVALDKAIDIL